MKTASIEGSARSFSKSVKVFGLETLMVAFAFSMRSSNLSQRAVIAARGSAWTMLAS
jgi:hypothetical protein